MPPSYPPLRTPMPATEVSLRSRVRRGSISFATRRQREKTRRVQIFPRAKARNRGHSSSWEGPRAPRSLPRSVHPGRKKTKRGFTGAVVAPASLSSFSRCAARLHLQHPAGPARSRLTKIVIPRWHARLSKDGRLICVSFNRVSNIGAVLDRYCIFIQ